MSDPTDPTARSYPLRLDPAVRAVVDAYARDTRRSVNGALNHLIVLGLIAEGRLPTK